MTGARRLTPLLGVGGVALLMVGNQLTKVGGDSPALHAPAAEYADSVGSSGLVVLGVYSVVLAWLALAGFFRSVAERIREHRDGERAARLVTAGGYLAAAVGISGAPPLLAATVLVGDGELTSTVLKALVLMNAAVFVLGWLLVAVPLGVSAAVGMRRQVFGRGLGWTGIAVAGALAIGSVVVWFAEGVLLVWLAGLIWIVVAAVALARGPHRAHALLRTGRRPERRPA